MNSYLLQDFQQQRASTLIKGFQNEENDLGFEQMEDNDFPVTGSPFNTDDEVEKAFSDLMNFDTIEKGAKANIGEIRTWGGKRYRKEAEGKWKPVLKDKEGGEKEKEGGEFKLGSILKVDWYGKPTEVKIVNATFDKKQFWIKKVDKYGETMIGGDNGRNLTASELSSIIIKRGYKSKFDKPLGGKVKKPDVSKVKEESKEGNNIEKISGSSNPSFIEDKVKEFYDFSPYKGNPDDIQILTKTKGDEPYRITKNKDGSYSLRQAYQSGIRKTKDYTIIPTYNWGKVGKSGTKDEMLKRIAEKHNKSDEWMKWGKIDL